MHGITCKCLSCVDNEMVGLDAYHLISYLDWKTWIKRGRKVRELKTLLNTYSAELGINWTQ